MKTKFNSCHVLLLILLISFAMLLAAGYFGTPFNKQHSDMICSTTAIIVLMLAYFFIREINRTKRLHEKLLMSEEYARETLNSLEEGVITTDMKGIVQSMNPSAERLTLWQISDTIGQPLEKIYDIVNETTGQPFQNIVSRILQEGKTIEFENNTILRKKDSKQIIISNSGSPIRDTKGEIIGAVLVFRDITDRKKLTAEKKKLSKRLVLATKSAGIGIWEWHIEQNILLWDKGMYKLHNIQNPRFLTSYQQWMAYLHPEDKNRVMEEMQKAIKEQHEYNSEYRIIWNDSSVHYIRATGIVETNTHGQAIRIIGTNWDETEKKMAEVRIRKSEAFNRGVLQSLNAHIAVIDASGEIIAVNEAWTRYGKENNLISPEFAGVGRNYFDICTASHQSGDETAGKILMEMKRVMAGTKDVFYYEYPCHHPEKQEWFSMKVMKFQNDDQMIVVAHENITAVKLAEQEREKVTYDLIQRNKNIEQFSYIVSHNLRAPLANILGYVELLKLESSSSEILNELMDGMSIAANKLDDVIKDLNIILQVRTQTFETRETVNFQEIVREITLSIDKVIKTQNAVIKTDFKSVENILSVKSYLYSIFYNLIYNSIKYQKPGINVHIDLKSQQTSNGVRLIFKDNGSGIDLEKNREKLFGLYKRFHSNIEGKGIGLYMVKNQVETLGGKIQVSSEVDKGTEFIIDFEGIKTLQN